MRGCLANRVTGQMKEWAGEFGREYTDRNALSLEDMEDLYRERYGVTRTEMNQQFVGNVSRDISILEVGANIGNQLLCLRQMGFSNLRGIELQPYAVGLAKAMGVDVLQGSALNLPFADNSFDLVFTSGLLIHIAPRDIGWVVDEIWRCSKRYVWGFEYYSRDYREIRYRGHDELLWSADFCKFFVGRFYDWNSAMVGFFRCLDSENIDTMFLIGKAS